MVGFRPLRRIVASVPNLLSAASRKMRKRHSRHVDHYALSDDSDSDSHVTKRAPTPMSEVLRYNEYTYSVDTPPTHTTGYFAVPNTPAELSRDNLVTNDSVPDLIPVTVDTDSISEEVVPDEDIFDDCDLRYIMQCLESVEDTNEGHAPRKRTAGVSHQRTVSTSTANITVGSPSSAVEGTHRLLSRRALTARGSRSLHQRSVCDMSHRHAGWL